MAKYGSLPFAEQIAFFRGKLNIPTRAWTDVWRDAHDTSFMVAGAYKAELIADFRESVRKGIEDGTTIQAFRKEFDQIVAKHGWSYKGGRGWRTRVIYETNLRTSYQAGRYAQLTDPDLLQSSPYWRYKHSESVRFPRPHHVAWDGLVLRHDDPWWRAHFPPNGWGCFPAEALMRCDALLGLKTWYAGEMVELHTVLGNRITATANHPVLTRHGWISAHEIQKGDEVIGAAWNVDAELLGIVDHKQTPSRADDLFQALAAQGFRVVPMAPDDFHGDAKLRKPEIHIAGSDGALMNIVEAALLDGSPFDSAGIGSSTQPDALVPTTSLSFCQLLEANPRAIARDEIVQVHKFQWSGHVYDFVTKAGLIMAGGILVSNCKCRVYSESDRTLRKLGKSGPDQAPTVEYETKTVGTRGPSPRTVSVPKGVDPGWDYAPGRTVAAQVREQIRQRIPTLPQPIAQQLSQALDRIPAPPLVPPRAPKNLDDYINAGAEVAALIEQEAGVSAAGGSIDHLAYRATLLDWMARNGGRMKVARVEGRGLGARIVRDASQLFPDAWTEASNLVGTVRARLTRSRGHHRFRFTGDSEIAARTLTNAVHEYTHRLQSIFPALDNIFQELHRRRTAGELLQSLRALSNGNYKSDEITRPDRYIDPYYGKQYSGAALEVLTMAMEHMLGWDAREFKRLRSEDPEMFRLALGVLFYWRP